MAEIGYLALLFALLVTLYSIIAYILGIKNDNKRLLASARGGVLSLAVLTTVASGSLVYLLLTSDFSVEYVAHYTSSYLPPVYKAAAFWAGNAGSLLLWLWVLAVIAAIVAYSRPKRGQEEEMLPYVSMILMIVALFFTYLVNFVANPFEPAAKYYADGYGLNPLLQNPGMIIHPTTLYIGYVGFTVPYAYAMTALILRKTGDAWIKVTRRWTLFAWLFLSIGIIYGAQWAYVELGWGGYWAWDPVENASLLPWLTGTAFLHSVMIQERKGMLKVWNIMLILVTFLLTIFGTFLTRSGILQSVHAFGDSNLGTYFLVFMGALLAVSLFLALDRLPLLRDQNQFESVLSKESSFLLNNLLLVGSAFAVFFGTMYPLISEAVTGDKVSVQAPFFNTVNVPIGIVLVALIGVCPLIAWKRATLRNLVVNFLVPFIATVIFAVAAYLYGIRHLAALVSYTVSAFVVFTIILEVYHGVRVRRKMTGEGLLTAFGRLFTRNRRRYGGYLVHLAVVMMVVGITGSSVYKVEGTASLDKGESMQVGDYTLTFDEGLKATIEPHKAVIYTDLVVSKGDQALGRLRTAKEAHHNAESLITEVGVKGGLREDLFVILAGFSERDYRAVLEGRPSQDPVTFKVFVNPLVAWFWLGEYVLILGTLFAMWPGRRLKAPVTAGGMKR